MRLNNPAVAWLPRAAWYAVLGVALLLTSGALVGAFGTLLDPFTTLAMASSLLLPMILPHMTLTSLVALLVAVVGLRLGPKRLSLVASITAVLALLASATLTAQFVQAATAAGGSVDPISGLSLSPITGVPPDSRETYTIAGGQALSASIYRPATAAPAPVMLYVHGGGWSGNTADTDSADHRWFADQGWLVISVDYRLATANLATWDEAPRDVTCALGWVGQNAARLGGDARRIVVGGDSAGGNLALNLAYSAALGLAESDCGLPIPVPAAVVVRYPVADPLAAHEHGNPTLVFGETEGLVAQYIGGRPETFPDRIRAISTATYLSPKAPPTLFIQPERDTLVPAAGNLRFAEQARAAGVDITLVRMPFSNHAADLFVANSIGNQAYRTVTQHYLKSRGLTASR